MMCGTSGNLIYASTVLSVVLLPTTAIAAVSPEDEVCLLQHTHSLSKHGEVKPGQNIQGLGDWMMNQFGWLGPYGWVNPHGSQFGQDDWVLKQFRNATSAPHFFVDIGARDGQEMSNSVKLEKHGWNGICVEPFPTNFEARRCALSESVLSAVEGENVAFKKCETDSESGTRAGFSGISDTITGVYKDDVAHCPTLSRITTTIGAVLTKHQAPKVIDFISLDIEGQELKVLESFPFNEHCVRFWIVEHNHDEKRRSQMAELLKPQGCELVKSFRVDDYFKCSCP